MLLHQLNLHNHSVQLQYLKQHNHLQRSPSPPSLEVRNVRRTGMSFKTSWSSLAVSNTFSVAKTSSNQSTRHSTTSTGRVVIFLLLRECLFCSSYDGNADFRSAFTDHSVFTWTVFICLSSYFLLYWKFCEILNLIRSGKFFALTQSGNPLV